MPDEKPPLCEADNVESCGSCADPRSSTEPSALTGESAESAALRQQVLELVEKYYDAAFPSQQFDAAKSRVPCAGRVFDADELKYAVEASLDFWLTLGRFGHDFEQQFARYFGVNSALLVNSGSSANLLALTALTSTSLGERRLAPGDEVITVACGFPTTVNPIVQNRLIPVFVDVDIPTYNIDATQLEAALSPRTKAIMIAHTLGNPFDLSKVKPFAEKNNLFLIEDCCDAVGSTFAGKKVGTFGDLATVSFYPAHHITMGEGGCVLTNNGRYKKLVESFRDWGRDCWCEPGADNTCGKRFAWQLGQLPEGFDHKYTYSHIGYNLKPTDLQAAVGVAQLKKLDSFIAQRKRNFAALKDGLGGLTDTFILPEATAGSDPSWFGFPLLLREEAGFTRHSLIQFLEANRIQTRLLFGGNLTRQPAFLDVAHRTVGDLKRSDRVMNQVFWVGVYPGLTEPAIEYMIETFHKAVSKLRA
ncbi:MAG TPA: lipopolysaccharide biosynthesis protein RfbH [Planktothrix sp.]